MNDRASIPVLEAVLIGVVMVGAIAFVVTYDAPTQTTDPERRTLEDAGIDALTLIYETPLTDVRYGNNTLSKFIALSLQGNSDPLVNRLREILPPATDFNVYINNGYGSLPVYVSRAPTGETVTTTKLLEPKWTYVFTERSHKGISSPTRLGTFALPVYNSNPIDDGGVPIVVEVSGLNKDTGRPFNLSSYYSTVQRANGTTAANTALHLLASDDSPTLFRSLSSGQTTTLRVAVKDTSGNGVPVGTKLVIRVPRGLEPAVSAAANPSWEILEAHTDLTDAGRIVARWNGADVLSDEVFRFDVTPYLDYYDFFKLDMRLSGAVLGVAEAILQIGDSPIPTGGDFHGVYASIPKPMGAGEANTWLVSFLNPRTLSPGTNESQLVGLDPGDDLVTAASRRVALTSVTISQPDGLPLFSAVNVEGGSQGWTLASASKLAWSGNLELSPNTVTEWVLEVTGTAYETRREIRDYLAIGVNADGYASNLTRRIQPAVFFDDLPPRVVLANITYNGYPPASANNRALDTTAGYRGVTIPGAWHFNTSVAEANRDNLNLVNVTVEDRLVPVGTTARVDADAQNLLIELAYLGVPATTSFRVYAPYSLDNHTAIKESSSTESDFLQSGISQLVVNDVNADLIDDVVVITTANKLYALDGRNGHKLSGYQGNLVASLQSKGIPTTSLGTARSMEMTTIDGQPVYVIGMSAGKPNLFVLNADFTLKWSTNTTWVYSEAGLRGWNPQVPYAQFDGFGINDIESGVDITGDGVRDIIVADTNGMIFAFNGSTGALVPTWTYDTKAENALIRAGKIGPLGQDGFFITTGNDASIGLADTEADYSASTFANDPQAVITDVLKRPYVENHNPGLVGMDQSQNWQWFVNGGGFDAMAVADVDGDGVSDFVGGAADGFVYAYNGTLASFPLFGEAFLTGSSVVDSAWVDANHGWTVGYDGFFMFTTDGWTTRNYFMDPVTQYVALPLARAVDFVDTMNGVVVGDMGRIWTTSDGGWQFTQKSYTVTIKGPGNLVNATIPATAELDRSLRDALMFDANSFLVVGNKCDNCGGKAIVMSTTDGGATWTDATWSGTVVSSTLKRIVKIDDLTVVVLGENGAAAIGRRQIDGTWNMTRVTNVPGGETLNGGHFTTLTDGFVVGDNGAIYETTDAGTSWSKRVSGTTRRLNDIDFLDAAKGGEGKMGAVVGDDGIYMQTYDAGANWHVLPGYVLTDNTRVNILDDGYGYIFGGNATTRFFGTLHTYMPESTFETLSLNTLSSGYYTKIGVVMDSATTGSSTNIRVEASVDGTNWFELIQVANVGAYKKWENATFAGVYAGGELRVRLTLLTELALNAKSYVVKNMTVTGDYTTGGVTGSDAVQFAFTQANRALTNWVGKATTADYNDTYSELRAARQDRKWILHVNGAVTDLRFAADMSGDGLRDVILATGATPSSATITSLGLDVSLLPDQSNRVFAHQGDTGETLWMSDGFDGPVVMIRSANLTVTQDGIPDVIAIIRIAATAGTPAHDYVAFLNGTNGQLLGAPMNLGLPTTALAVGNVKTGSGSEAVIGTAPPTGSSRAGYVHAFEVESTPTLMWQTNPNMKGVYSFSYDVPKNSLFGVYPVEIEISWTHGGVDFAQRTLTYFIATPPTRVMPTSPIYNVELVAWYKEWDFR